MDQRHDIIRILSTALPYKPLKNPSPGERVAKRIESRAARTFAGGFLIMAILWLVRIATGALPTYLAWPGLIVAVISIVAGLTYTCAEFVAGFARGSSRAVDEAHHHLARLDHRTPQVEALSGFDDDALEDIEDQFRARLNAAQSRISTLLGEKTAVVTSVLSVVTAWKVLTDLGWVSSGSPLLGVLIGAGIVITLAPALTKGFSETLVYQCDLLASARKRKGRGEGKGVEGDAPRPSAANDDATTATVRVVPLGIVAHWS